tara:strand:- start:411 stop:2255 length:1845 start_codon:yes stop_codon:yes gene_type:complete
MKVAPFAVACVVIFAGLQSFLNGTDQYVEYDIDEMNEFWDSTDNHSYSTRSSSSQQSVDIADRIISHDEIYLLRYWDPVVISKSTLDWSEDPFDDWTWQFYYHSLRMVSYLVSAYESTENISYLQEAKWYIGSWIEHNPGPEKQASERAWDDHSTANRILTFIQFWDSYRDSPIKDETFSILFLNILRLHGEFTADSDNYYWGHNHGIYQDRALLQLSVLFPNFEESDVWNDVANDRLDLHLIEDFTESGVHKEHSPSYHFLVLSLMMSVNDFNQHYNLGNEKLELLIYKMQDYLAYIVKPDGSFPLVGDSGFENGLRLKESSVVSENLLDLMTRTEGDSLDHYCKAYHDSGVGINKLEFSNGKEMYFAIFSAFHSTVHKQSDDLSFVLTYGDTDYFVDSGKYNFDESDEYRKYVRSVFAHNTIIVDNISYDYRETSHIGKSSLYYSECNEGFALFQAKHTIYDGVTINRNVVIIHDKGVFIHDSIESNSVHDYSQIFQLGENVNVEITHTNEMILQSSIDDTSMVLRQLEEFSSYDLFNGSNDPIRGWRSEYFNQIEPITSVAYYKSDTSTEFRTMIQFDDNQLDVEVIEREDSPLVYLFTDEENGTQTINLD